MTIGFFAPLSLHEIIDLIYEEQRANVPEGLKFTVGSSLIRYYIRLGHTVVAVTLDKTIKKEKIYTGKNLIVYVGIYRNSSKIRAITKFNFEIRQMVRFAQKYPCDIYHAHWEYEFALAAMEVDCDKTLVTLHDWPYVIIRYLPGFYRYQRLQMSIKVLKKCSFFTAVSPYIAELYKNYSKKNNICVIPNAVEGGLQELPPQRLNKEKPYLIAINNGFDERKNVKTLLSAFAMLHRTIPGAELHLFGYGYGPHESAQEWAKMNYCLNEKVFFEGFYSHEEICKKLKNADLLIHPSKEESFGLIFLEAMQNGTPCIGGRNAGAVKWVLEGGKAGILTDVEEPAKIAESIVDILQNEEKWQWLRQYGFEYVQKNFSIDSIAEKYLEVYQTMI